MTHAEQFYPGLHSADEQYSGAAYHMDSLVNLSGFLGWLGERGNNPVRLVDIGCGKGRFLRDLVIILRDRWKVTNIQASGTDLVRSPGDLFAEISPNFHFVQHNLDGQVLPFPDASFDFLSCNHVLEHIFHTEKLLREFRRVMAPNALGVISVPNLSAWVNRITFLFAGQPLGSELGTEEIKYGYWPRFLQPKLERFKPSGHIRDFTPRGLEDLTRHCGFQTVGWWKQSFGPIARMGKWAGRGVGIVIKPAR